MRAFSVPIAALTLCAVVGLSGFVAIRSDAASTLVTPTSLAPASGARVISQTQFANTVVGLFGPDFRLSEAFAPIRREKGLVAVGSSSTVITPGAFDRLEGLARRIATKTIDPTYRDLLVPCRPAAANGADPACTQQFISRTGRLLFRRPLTQKEIAGHSAIANNTAATLKDFYAGIGDGLVSLLVSPEFLFIRETSTRRADGNFTLTGSSKATRLSILLWDAYPDEELLTAAENGSLDTARGLQYQVDRMLASPRVASSARALFTDLLQFDKFETLSKDSVIYPAFTGKVIADSREQTIRLIVDHLITNGLDYRDLFTTRKTFLTNDLGTVYKIPVTKPDQWVEYTFPEDSPRAGLMTSISMLALYSHPGRSSPTRRGRALRELLLCQPVPEPPANVDFSQFEDPHGKVNTARERLTAHSQNPVCAGCHKITDPIGLALEHFDGAGQYRADESGAPIDSTGALNGVNFKDAKGLGEALRNDPALVSCIVNRTSAFSLGRGMTAQDADWLKYLQVGFAEGGYRFRPLLKMIATSDAFYTIPSAAPSPPVSK